MKKILLPLVALMLCMVACQKDNEGIIKLEVEQYTGNTKIHLNNNYAVWDNNDDVWVNGNTYAVCVDNNSASLSDIPTNTNGYKAVYPASWVSASASASADYIGISYPAEQTFRTNSNGEQIVEAPMAAYSDGGVLKFHNLGSILAVTVTNSNTSAMNVQKIEVISSTGIINGTFTIRNITTSPILQISMGGGSNTTTLICNGVSIAAGDDKTFYIAMPTHYASATAECSFAPLLSIKVYDQAFTYTKTQDISIPLEASHGYPAPISTTDDPEQYAPLSNQIWYTASQAFGSRFTITGLSSNNYDATSQKGILTFNSDITSVPEQAFKGLSHLISVTLPVGVSVIGNKAFYGCSSLTSVSMPGVITIGNNAFQNCTSLTSVSMPNVTTIGDLAFSNCTSLTSVSMPSVTTIGTGVSGGPFLSCTSLATITLPACLTSVEGNSFGGCPITNIYCYKTEPIGISTDWGIPVLPAEDQFLHVPEGATGWSDWWFSGNGTVLYDL